MSLLTKLSCNSGGTLIDAWKTINENTKGTVFIINDENILQGILTDGDIRRYLLSGGRLESGIEDVMNRNFSYGNLTESHESLLKKLNDRVKIIPIVDNSFKLVDYVEYRANFYIPVAMPDLKGNEFNYLADAFLSTWISSTGEYIQRFEKQFSVFCDSEYGVAVSNGTVAIHLALTALGVGQGDEVIIPDLTFAATINAVLLANAIPVIVDINSDDWNISPSEIQKAITSKTKAIIPVHLYGQPCDMDQIMKIAKENNLYVIEDCAEAHGAKYKGRKVGSFGEIACFSFFGNKVITTGEGGMCVTNSAALDTRMRILRDHGMSKTKKYWHEMVGFNYRMTNLQAAIGLAQLERIDEILNWRRHLENDYRVKFEKLNGVEFQNILQDRDKITWLVSILVDSAKRDNILNSLKSVNIDARPFFYSLGIMEIYQKYLFSNKQSLLVSERGINLPTSPSVTAETIKMIYEHLDKQ
jgi:perosamine synthetase